LLGFGLDFDSAGPYPPFQFSSNVSPEADSQQSPITSDAASVGQRAETAENRPALLLESPDSEHEQF